MKTTARYWVNLGHWDSFEVDDPELKRKIAQTRAELGQLATGVSGDTFLSLVYKTEDLDEAKEVYRKAKAILQRVFSDDILENYLEYGYTSPIVEELSITRQPGCPNCGFLGRFSDEYCSSCGTELMPKEYIDVDE